MESLWPELFNEQDIKTPKEILEIQAKFLPKLTKDLVYAEIIEANSINSLFNGYDFVYKLNVKGKFLDNYKFTILTFGHNVTLYPVKLHLDKDISREVQQEQTLATLENQGEFISLLKSIFNSEKMKIVITAIMKLSN